MSLWYIESVPTFSLRPWHQLPFLESLPCAPCQVNINSLEEVIKYFLKKAGDRAEEAQQKAAVRLANVGRSSRLRGFLSAGSMLRALASVG